MLLRLRVMARATWRPENLWTKLPPPAVNALLPSAPCRQSRNNAMSRCAASRCYQLTKVVAELGCFAARISVADDLSAALSFARSILTLLCA